MADNLGFGNPYFQQSLDASLGDTVKAFNNVTAPAFTSAMVRSGSFGNSGLQQMQQEAQSQLQQNLGRQANDFYANNYWQDQGFNRQLYNDSFGMQQQNFNNQLNLLGLANQAGQQNLGFGTQIQNTPLNYWGQFANQANGFGQGFATEAKSLSAPGSPAMGALAGWQLGGQLANMGKNSWGNSIYNPTTNTGGWTGTSLGDTYYRGTGGIAD